MSTKPKVNPTIALAIAIGSGVVFGLLIKRFRVGLILGIFISLLYVLIAGSKRKQ